MNGVLVLDKPEGPTSFDMVARLRRAAGERRVGHAGTLDPMATGVLVCCLGEATKLVPFLMSAEKEYRATLRLGITTDTDDAAAGSRVLTAADPARLQRLTVAQVRDAIAAQRGTVLQRPPRFSALKLGGRRLYERARADEDMAQQIEEKARLVVIHEIEIEEIDLPRVVIWVRCGKGTYIRSIVRDVGEQLGVGAHLTALRRLRVGRFTTADATPLLGAVPAPDGAGGGDGFAAPPRLFGLAEALAHLPRVTLDEEAAARLRNGQRGAMLWAARRLGRTEAEAAAAIDPRGRLVAVLERSGDAWRIARGFSTR